MSLSTQSTLGGTSHEAPSLNSHALTAEQSSQSPVENSTDQAANHGLTTISNTTAKELVGLFKLLSDETRLKILSFLLQSEELNVRTLCQNLNQSQPAVSHHLALMKAAHLIDCRRDGKHNFYYIVPETLSTLLGRMFSSTPGIKSNQLQFNDRILRLDQV